jgi:hypothetical protein
MRNWDLLRGGVPSVISGLLEDKYYGLEVDYVCCPLIRLCLKSRLDYHIHW